MMTRTGAQRAFETAEMLKGGDFDTNENLSASLERVQQELVSWEEASIDAFIRDRDPIRFGKFERATWRLDTVDLDKCIVSWAGGTGQLGEWATGKVMEIANRFREKQPQKSRVWNMQEFAVLFASRLPLIVFVVGPSTFAIDDGCHRAVGMALAGVTSSSAWIGIC